MSTETTPLSAVHVEPVVSVRFNDAKTALPEEMPIADDCRYFLFVDEDGTPYCGMYLKEGVFKDTEGMVHEFVSGWAEWTEAPPHGR